MNIPEELARNRAAYSRMRGQDARELPVLPQRPPRLVAVGERTGVEREGLRMLSPAEPVKASAFAGLEFPAEAVGTATPAVRGEAAPVYTLGRIREPPAPEVRGTTVVSVPGPAYPEAGREPVAAGTDPDAVLAALARRLESDARQRPQLQSEGEGDGM